MSCFETAIIQPLKLWRIVGRKSNNFIFLMLGLFKQEYLLTLKRQHPFPLSHNKEIEVTVVCLDYKLASYSASNVNT